MDHYEHDFENVEKKESEGSVTVMPLIKLLKKNIEKNEESCGAHVETKNGDCRGGGSHDCT